MNPVRPHTGPRPRRPFPLLDGTLDDVPRRTPDEPQLPDEGADVQPEGTTAPAPLPAGALWVIAAVALGLLLASLALG